MINKLIGLVTDKAEKLISVILFQSLVLEVFVISSDEFIIGTEYTIYIAMLFSSEKGYILYGFLEEMQKKYFLILQDCRGVGAKIALLILSHLSLNQIYQGIITENKSVFESVSGIGNKKAEIIILELKSKISKLNIPIKKDFYRLHDDFIAALKSLGYNQKEINIMTKEVYQSKISLDISLSQLIEKALTLEKM